MNLKEIINPNRTINYSSLNKLCLLLNDNPTHDFDHLFAGQTKQYRTILNHFLQKNKDTIIDEITRIEFQSENKFYSDNYQIMLYYLNQQLVTGTDLETIVWTLLNSDNPFLKPMYEDCLITILKQKEPLHPDMLEDIYGKCTRKQAYYETQEQLSCTFPYDWRYYLLKREDVCPNLRNRVINQYHEQELTNMIKQLEFDLFESAKEQNIFISQKDKEKEIWSKIYHNPNLCKDYAILATLKNQKRKTKEYHALIKVMCYR